MRKPIIVCDFDGTIVEHQFPRIGELRIGAKEALRKLYNDGCYIIIWTCRGGSELDECRNFLDDNDILYHKINENAPYEMVGFSAFPKVYGDVYIDDRNLGGVPAWDDIYGMIKNKFYPIIVRQGKCKIKLNMNACGLRVRDSEHCIRCENFTIIKDLK